MPSQEEYLCEILDLPPSCPGAPIPIIVADERDLRVFYYLPRHLADAAEPDDPQSWESSRSVAAVSFHRVEASYFGWPNDEAIHGHPLYQKGLQPYAAYEVLESSWIATIVRRNAVHHRHRDEHFADLRHFILAFHDSTLEIIAESYKSKIVNGPVQAAAQDVFLSAT